MNYSYTIFFLNIFTLYKCLRVDLSTKCIGMYWNRANVYYAQCVRSRGKYCTVSKFQQPSKITELLAEKNGKEEETVVSDSLTKIPRLIPKEKTEFRKNPLNIQMLSANLYDQLFKDSHTTDENVLKMALNELSKYDLPSKLHKVPDIELQLPPLEGNIVDHFYKIGKMQSEPYSILMDEFLKQEIPDMPKEWVFREGWTRYGKEIEQCDYPKEKVMIFDVEVCCREGDLPTLATAVTSEAWYSWVSKDLISCNTRSGRYLGYSCNDLIPLETPIKSKEKITEWSNTPKLCVGHHVAFDRARIMEQYWLNRTALRFIDTMSLHVAISGITSYQKTLLKSKDIIEDESWQQHSSLNSLNEVYKLYCKAELSKSDRDIFVKGSLQDINNDFQNLMSYCANDVIATNKVLRKLWPLFLERFPHPVTLAGILELGTSYLPVNSNWKRYLETSNEIYEDLDIESKFLLSQQANQACQLMYNDNYKKDLWLWDQNWIPKQIKLKKEKKKKPEITVENKPIETEDIYEKKFLELQEMFKPLMATCERMPLKTPHLAGYPEWYRKLCAPPKDPHWVPGPLLISSGMHLVPKLLSLMWKSLPLHYVRGNGWGQLVPYDTDIKLPDAELVPLKELQDHYIKNNKSCDCKIKINNTELHENVQTNLVKYECIFKKKNNKIIRNKPCKENLSTGCGLLKLPHKDGNHLNVGNPLARDFLNKFSQNGLSGKDSNAEHIIEISRMLSYWRNNRERVEGQIVVWNDKSKGYGAIIPQVVVCGTLTRRAVERTWMTAANAIDERVGSELRSMIQSPPGYSLVGADVDSQELWIASVIGDSYYGKEHGATAFGWMTLSGRKNDGTDMHSTTAKAIGITRDNAKVLNYARIYGAGKPFSERLLKQFNPDLSPAQAKQKAIAMFNMTKGNRIYKLHDNVLPEVKKREHSRLGAQELCTIYNKSVDELFDKPIWSGGSESAMFNSLEQIACSKEPKTPFLESRLSRALEMNGVDIDKFIPTRINWVVQSGAVDFLHLMLVCMRWLIHPNVRFCLSFHDEIRYLVPDEHRYQTALALHITNLLVRAFCVKKLGMTDLPQSVAFFSSVEVDTALRKDALNDCVTPSNPHGLLKGYGVPLGESLDIIKAIELSGGNIGVFKKKKRKADKTKD
ncbi:DNA polymerase subunit gamma-1, mitochondrial [Melanaphis sacchari]|uniref:DNA polymerase subunit gamma-1, mitochondrial n=1 Tax=Melanaphis sacchari TaxID=742174 RepID=UPI000DC15A4D|nr:DNA polymerase subunit gamma-1, mitochondrial [Melanaphis sacchari]